MKTLQLNYSFNKSTKQVTFTDINPIRLDSILLITDVTANVILYNFADPLKGGTVATNVLTLTYDTSALSNTDKLQIFYDDATATQNVTLPTAQVTTLTPPAAITGFATSAKQLADGHNVAVNNSSGASAVNVQDGGNTLTVDGTVAVTNAGLTALNGAVNSSKVDVNIASGNPTTITATQGTASNLNAAVVGTKTNNAALPSTTNLGVLPGVANASAPTWTETYDVKLSEDLSGNTRVTLGTLLAGENLTTNRLMVQQTNSYAHISTSTTTTVKSGAGFLHAVSVNTLGTVASTTTIYDNTAGSGTVIGVIATLTLSGSFVFDVSFATGLTIVTTGTAAPDLTISFI